MDSNKINKITKKNPLVTVIIDNYNYEQFIAEAIDSVLKQTYTNLELIIVDDGSIDNSPNIIKNYQQKYPSKIKAIFKENGGQASAFNQGFLKSTGEIICLLDSDDLWLANKVSQVVKTYIKHPQANLIYHPIQPIDRQGKYLGKSIPTSCLSGMILTQVIKAGGWWNFPPTSAVSYSRTFLNKIMPIPELNYRISADSYLADIAPFLGEVIALKHNLAYYRLHGKNQWSESNQEFLSETAMKNRLLFYQNRTDSINQQLKQLNLPYQVDINQHYPYCLLKYLLGEPSNFIRLLWLILTCPVESSLNQRIRNTLRLMVKRRSLKLKR